MRSHLMHPLFRAEPSTGRADIFDDGERYLLHLEAAGFTSEDFSIVATNNSIDIKAERNNTPPTGFEGEGTTDTIHRRFRFAQSVDSDAVKAIVKDGLLTLQLPKRSARRIDIAVA